MVMHRLASQQAAVFGIAHQTVMPDHIHHIVRQPTLPEVVFSPEAEVALRLLDVGVVNRVDLRQLEVAFSHSVHLGFYEGSCAETPTGAGAALRFGRSAPDLGDDRECLFRQVLLLPPDLCRR